jgi:hypothetical protein
MKNEKLCVAIMNSFVIICVIQSSATRGFLDFRKHYGVNRPVRGLHDIFFGGINGNLQLLMGNLNNGKMVGYTKAD